MNQLSMHARKFDNLEPAPQRPPPPSPSALAKDLAGGMEDDEFTRILEMSRREEEERQQKKQLEDTAVTVVLAESLQRGAGLHEAVDTELLAVLRESQRLEDTRRREEAMEDEHMERALRESLSQYEVFHASGEKEIDANDLFDKRSWDTTDNVDHGSVGSSSEDDVMLRDAILQAYDEGDSSPHEEVGSSSSSRLNTYLREPAHSAQNKCSTTDWLNNMSNGSASSHNAEFHGYSDAPTNRSSMHSGGASSSSFLANKSGSPASSSSWVPGPPPVATPVALGSVAQLDQEWHGVIGGRAAVPLDPKAWLLNRMQELNIEFDAEVLWSVLDQIPREQLSDMEVVKMWLGFPPEQQLPFSLHCLISEFRLKRFLDRDRDG